MKPLETKRLYLRAWKESDAADLYKYAKDVRVGPAAGWQPHTSVENSADIIRNVLSAEGTYAIVLKETNEVIGSVGLMIGEQSHIGLPDTEAEIGYWLGVPYWGQGMIPEAVCEVIRFAFEELKLNTLWCGYFIGNDKSKRVQEKCGFVYEYTKKDVELKLLGEIRDENISKLTKENWFAAGLFYELSLFSEVEAVALGGSRAGEHYDEKSDYDVYVYCQERISEQSRKAMLSKYCDRMEIGNHFWELEDNCTLKSGIDIDIIYRDFDAFMQEISAVVDKHQSYNGYTTCMWHNLCNSKILYDKSKRLTNAKKKYQIPYPQELKKHIIGQNMRLLRGSMPAYDGQIKKAVMRGDFVSVNHRTTEFLASYFDILFALNEMTHPGEKRLIQLCKAKCKYLPVDFEENLNKWFGHMFAEPEKLEADVDAVITALEKIIAEQNIKYL